MLIGNKQMLNETSKMTTPVFLHDMCRVCMLTSDCLKDVVSYDLTPKIINMLNSFAGINVMANDCLPSLICSSCYKRLQDSFEFRNLCMETNNTLQNFISQMQCDALTVTKKRKVFALPLNLSLNDKDINAENKLELEVSPIKIVKEIPNSVEIIDLEEIQPTKTILQTQESSSSDSTIAPEPSNSMKTVDKIISTNKINVQKLASSAQIIDRKVSKNKTNVLKPTHSTQITESEQNTSEIIDLDPIQPIKTKNTPRNKSNAQESPNSQQIIEPEQSNPSQIIDLDSTKNLTPKNKTLPLSHEDNLTEEQLKSPIIIQPKSANSVQVIDLKLIKVLRNLTTTNKVQSLLDQDETLSNAMQVIEPESSNVVQMINLEPIQPIKITRSLTQKNNNSQPVSTNQESTLLKTEKTNVSTTIELEPVNPAQIIDLEPIQPKTTRNISQKIKTQSLPVSLNKDELTNLTKIEPELVKSTKMPRSPNKKNKDTSLLDTGNNLIKEPSNLTIALKPEPIDSKLNNSQPLSISSQNISGTLKDKSSSPTQIYEIVDLEPQPIKLSRKVTPRNKNKPLASLTQNYIKSETKLEEETLNSVKTEPEAIQPIKTRNITLRNKNKTQQIDAKLGNHLEELSNTVETHEQEANQQIKNTRNVTPRKKNNQLLLSGHGKTGTILKEKLSNSAPNEPETIQLKTTRNSSPKKVKAPQSPASPIKVFIKSEHVQIKTSPKTKTSPKSSIDLPLQDPLKIEIPKIENEPIPQYGLVEEPSAELLRALGLIKKSPDSTDVNSNETTPRIRKRRIIVDDDSDSSGYSSKSKKVPKNESSDDNKKFRKLFQCNVCTDEITEYGAYRRHLASHGELPFVCKICGKRFSQARALKEHTENTHSGHRPYNCAKCNSRFKTLDELTIHLRRHAGNTSPYACQLCPFRSSSGRQLRDHSITHAHERKPEEKFKRSATGSGSHACRMCQRRFRKKCDLERHERVHSGEKPYVCVLCNGRFQQAHNLTKHMTKHTGVRSYTCDICNKTFGRSDVLARHMHVHEVSKPFSCGQCQRTFARQSQLDRHLEKKHSNSNVEVKMACLPVT